MKNYWFSSDWHLGHKNILKYDFRPFASIEEHDEAIVANYNEVVHDRDDFYFLGDFCLDYRIAEQHLSRLKGHLFFVKGNHDTTKMVQLYEKYGTYLGGLADITIDGQRIVLCHYRMDVWNHSHRGSWNLHGHSHHTLKPSGKKTLDLGINGWKYKPLEFNQIKQHFIDEDRKEGDRQFKSAMSVYESMTGCICPNWACGHHNGCPHFPGNPWPVKPKREDYIGYDPDYVAKARSMPYW